MDALSKPKFWYDIPMCYSINSYPEQNAIMSQLNAFGYKSMSENLLKYIFV